MAFTQAQVWLVQGGVTLYTLGLLIILTITHAHNINVLLTTFRIGHHRPGSLIAGTWAAMHYMGRRYVSSCSRCVFPCVAYPYEPCNDTSGYLESCRSLVRAARRIAAAVTNEIPELYVLGNPPASVVAFAAREGSGVSVLQVGDLMSARGWHLCGLSNPAGLHIAVTVSPILHHMVQRRVMLWKHDASIISNHPCFEPSINSSYLIFARINNNTSGLRSLASTANSLHPSIDLPPGT